MEKIITDAFLAISLILGTGLSVKTVHQKARALTKVALLQKKSPALISFTAKLTRK